MAKKAVTLSVKRKAFFLSVRLVEALLYQFK